MSVSSLTTLLAASHSSGGGCVPPPTPTRQPRPGSPWPFSPSVRTASYCWHPTVVMGTSASLLHRLAPAPAPPHSCRESFHSLLFRSPTSVYVSSLDPDRYTPFLLYSDLPLLSTQSCWVFNQGDSGGVAYSHGGNEPLNKTQNLIIQYFIYEKFIFQHLFHWMSAQHFQELFQGYISTK